MRHLDDAFVVRGADAYRYLNVLLPYLDGATPLTDIVAGLPEAHASAVRSLLTTLAERGVLADGRDPLAEHDKETVDRYGGQLAFLDHHGDTGGGFARVAAARVLVAGDGAADLVAALRANGTGSGEGWVRSATPSEALALLDGHGDGEGEGEGDASGAGAGVDAVCLVAAERPSRHLFALADACAARGTAFLPLLRVGERLVLGPWQADGQGDVCSAVLRMTDNALDGTAALWQAATAGPGAAAALAPLPGRAVAMGVSLAGFEVFKALAGVPASDVRDAVVVIDPHRLTVATERLLPHPSSPHAAEPAATPADRAGDAEAASADTAADASPEERAYRRYEPTVAATVGIACRFEDDAAVQVPVKVAALVAPALAPEPLVAFGSRSTLQARLTALETMAARYAVGVHRRLGLSAAAQAGTEDISDAEAVAPERLATWLGAPVTAPVAVPATDLEHGGPLSVERAAVLAGPWDRQAALFEPEPTGLAAAPTEAEARERALVDAAGALTVTALARGEAELREVPRALLATGPDAERQGRLSMLLGELEQDGTKVRTYAAHGPVPVAMVRVGDGHDQVVVRAGVSWSEAAHDALLEILGRRQIAGTPLETAPPPPGSGSRAADLGRLLPRGTAEDGAPLHRRHGSGEVLAALRAGGHRAAVVDLTPPDLRTVTAVSRVLLFTDHAPGEAP
ncbi:hypothetical protein [Streptomyces sp. NPDC048172]|uniref:hypothetical protein n=1 Tax=Streptomyces sp. NPDC048172 TaxID=3365505 RepID=UPI00371D3B34